MFHSDGHVVREAPRVALQKIALMAQHYAKTKNDYTKSFAEMAYYGTKILEQATSNSVDLVLYNNARHLSNSSSMGTTDTIFMNSLLQAILEITAHLVITPSAAAAATPQTNGVQPQSQSAMLADVPLGLEEEADDDTEMPSKETRKVVAEPSQDATGVPNETVLAKASEAPQIPVSAAKSQTESSAPAKEASVLSKSLAKDKVEESQKKPKNIASFGKPAAEDTVSDPPVPSRIHTEGEESTLSREDGKARKGRKSAASTNKTVDSPASSSPLKTVKEEAGVSNIRNLKGAPTVEPEKPEETTESPRFWCGRGRKPHWYTALSEEEQKQARSPASAKAKSSGSSATPRQQPTETPATRLRARKSKGDVQSPSPVRRSTRGKTVEEETAKILATEQKSDRSPSTSGRKTRSGDMEREKQNEMEKEKEKEKKQSTVVAEEPHAELEESDKGEDEDVDVESVDSAEVAGGRIVFPCPECGHRFPTEIILKMHMKNICRKQSNSLANDDNIADESESRTRKAGRKRPVNTPETTKPSGPKAKKTGRVREKHIETPTKFTSTCGFQSNVSDCLLCGETVRNSQFDPHLSKYHPTRPYTFNCLKCNKWFSSITGSYKHAETCGNIAQRVHPEGLGITKKGKQGPTPSDKTNPMESPVATEIARDPTSTTSSEQPSATKTSATTVSTSNDHSPTIEMKPPPLRTHDSSTSRTTSSTSAYMPTPIAAMQSSSSSPAPSSLPPLRIFPHNAPHGIFPFSNPPGPINAPTVPNPQQTWVPKSMLPQPQSSAGFPSPFFAKSTNGGQTAPMRGDNPLSDGASFIDALNRKNASIPSSFVPMKTINIKAEPISPPSSPTGHDAFIFNRPSNPIFPFPTNKPSSSSSSSAAGAEAS